MALLGLLGQASSAPNPTAKLVADPHLHFEEALACGGRLWIRGRVVDPALTSSEQDARSSLWRSWRPKPEIPALPATARIETRLGGQVLESTFPLTADGRFEATFKGEFPVTRRGWRIARNRVTYAERALEKCCVVLVAPECTVRAVVVVLPLTCTMEGQGGQRLTQSALAADLTPVLQQLRQQGQKHTFTYLACVPTNGTLSQAELGLATTTLGWPSGNFLLLATMREKAGQIVLDGIGQLRWLFAGNIELLVLNLEPAIAAGLVIQEPKPDHAKVHQLVNPGADAKVIFDDNPIPAVLISAPPRPIRAGLVPRQPVVFCHGMLAFSTLSMQMPEDSNCFSPLRDFLQSRGFRALFPHVAPTSSVALRAEQLREQISRWTNEPVNLIAHSMGGLDARFMISQLGMAKRVCSLTTVSTPHRGTYLVDWFLTNFRQRLPLMIALESAGFDVAGFRDCRPAACRDFNMRITDVPGVSYFSFGGEVPVGRVTPPLRRAWSLLSAEEGPNDGMVSVASARWGEYLGTVHADHFAQTPDLKFIHPSEDFDPLEFYFRILENLARRGF